LDDSEGKQAVIKEDISHVRKNRNLSGRTGILKWDNGGACPFSFGKPINCMVLSGNFAMYSFFRQGAESTVLQMLWIKTQKVYGINFRKPTAGIKKGDGRYGRFNS